MRKYISAVAVVLLLAATPAFAQTASVVASPVSGPAPLDVTFTIAYPLDGYTYVFFAGDQDTVGGQAIAWLQGLAEGYQSMTPITVGHKYTTPGTYSAALYKFRKSEMPIQYASYEEFFSRATLVHSQMIQVGTQDSATTTNVPGPQASYPVSSGTPMLTGGLSTAQNTDVKDLVTKLQAQIQVLLAQIAALKGQASPSVSQSCLDLKGSFGPDDVDEGTYGEVSKLQEFLVSQGLLASHLPRGYFGPATMRALQQWQKQKGIASSGTPDSTGYGFFGPKTRAAMGCGNSVASTASVWHSTTPVPAYPTPDSTTGCTKYLPTSNPNDTSPCTYYVPEAAVGASQAINPHMEVTSVVPVDGGTIVNVVFAGIQDGWNLRVIGVSGEAHLLPVSSITALPVSGQYTTGIAVTNYYQPSGGENFAALLVPSTAPAGSYVVEVSDPSSGWSTKLRTPPFAIGHAGSVTNSELTYPDTPQLRAFLTDRRQSDVSRHRPLYLKPTAYSMTRLDSGPIVFSEGVLLDINAIVFMSKIDMQFGWCEINATLLNSEGNIIWHTSPCPDNVNRGTFSSKDKLAFMLPNFGRNMIERKVDLIPGAYKLVVTLPAYQLTDTVDFTIAPHSASSQRTQPVIEKFASTPSSGYPGVAVDLRASTRDASMCDIAASKDDFLPIYEQDFNYGNHWVLPEESSVYVLRCKGYSNLSGLPLPVTYATTSVQVYLEPAGTPVGLGTIHISNGTSGIGPNPVPEVTRYALEQKCRAKYWEHYLPNVEMVVNCQWNGERIDPTAF